jgi:hypothetical protein
LSIGAVDLGDLEEDYDEEDRLKIGEGPPRGLAVKDRGGDDPGGKCEEKKYV